MSVKNKFYIQVGVAVSVFFVFVFYSWYTFNMLVEESKKYEGSKKELFELEEKGKKDKETIEKIIALKDEIDMVNSAFLPRDNELKFIVLVEDLAKKNSLNHDIEIIEVKKKKRTKKISNKTQFKIDLSGEFSGVLSFIKNIEKLEYYSSITNLDFERIASGSSSSDNDYLLKEGDVRATMIVELILF